MSFLQRLRARTTDRLEPLLADTVPPGTVLGNARVEQRLAHGSQGSVYAASRVPDGMPLAVKVVSLASSPEQHADEQAHERRRFLSAGERATRLVHPGIVRIYGGGISRGVAFLEMERVAGTDLTRYTRQGHLLPEPVSLDVAADMAEALAYAHQLGVTHRDVKPANVLFDPSTRRAKLVDFGMAREADAEATRSGVLLGSPLYMAPELLGGAPADAASDFYALGVLTYELLTGQPPFSSNSMGELLRAVAQQPPRRVGRLRPDLSSAQAGAIDDLLAPLLAKDARERMADGATWAGAARTVRALWAEAGRE